MKISIDKTAKDLGKSAAQHISSVINDVIKRNGEMRMVVSTGSSQFEMFESLIKEKIDWSKVEVFHLDEYIGLPDTHIASFRKYLYERFINHVPVKRFHSVNVEGNIGERIRDLSDEIRSRPVDLGLIGIGVNGHIAFNDPPADFDTREAYIIVRLNDICKKQQVDEGWFNGMKDVPDEAVSMSVYQIMQCKTIISCVPHLVKADAVYGTFQTKVTNMVPATMLKEHDDWHLYLDYDSASLLISL